MQLSVVAESRPQNPWVGLLARKVRIASCRFASRFTFPGGDTEWLFEATAFTHSGGTAPEFHRLPRYAHRGHPRQACILAQTFDAQRVIAAEMCVPPGHTCDSASHDPFDQLPYYQQVKQWLKACSLCGA